MGELEKTGRVINPEESIDSDEKSLSILKDARDRLRERSGIPEETFNLLCDLVVKIDALEKRIDEKRKYSHDK